VSDDATLEMLIKTTATQSAHTRIAAGCGGDAQFEIFEGTTVSDDGTPIDVWNRNRFSSNTAQTTTFSSPTISDSGTSVHYSFIFGGSGGKAAGGTGSGFDEWILKTDEIYLVRLTNKSGQTHPASIELNFYEPV